MSSRLCEKSHLWCKAPIEGPKPFGAELLGRQQRAVRVTHQRVHVHALARRQKRPNVLQSAFQHDDDAMIVPATQMVERHADLQDAPVQTSHRAWFRAPQRLERLVLLEYSPWLNWATPARSSGGDASMQG
jgi:hypothetical protein